MLNERFKKNYLSLRNQMDELLNNFINPVGDSALWRASQGHPFALDIIETGNEVKIKGDIPGVDPKDLTIEYNDGILTVSADRQKEKEIEGSEYKLVERRYGTFSRSIKIPSYLDVTKIKAKVKNGILDLTIPKKEELKPRSIKVEVEV